jgi:hypothetical protein
MKKIPQAVVWDSRAEKTPELARLSLMGLAAFVSYSGVWRHFLPFDLLAIAATLIGGYPIFKETLLSLRRKHVSYVHERVGERSEPKEGVLGGFLPITVNVQISNQVPTGVPTLAAAGSAGARTHMTDVFPA